MASPRPGCPVCFMGHLDILTQICNCCKVTRLMLTIYDISNLREWFRIYGTLRDFEQTRGESKLSDILEGLEKEMDVRERITNHLSGNSGALRRSSSSPVSFSPSEEVSVSFSMSTTTSESISPSASEAIPESRPQSRDNLDSIFNSVVKNWKF